MPQTIDILINIPKVILTKSWIGAILKIRIGDNAYRASIGVDTTAYRIRFFFIGGEKSSCYPCLVSKQRYLISINPSKQTYKKIVFSEYLQPVVSEF
jgi:hypothetical protein